ncbi:DNA polymerase I [Bacillus phage 015DV004]|nr:DNA polymerase I [Bacillus phage 015DV004]
MKVLFLLEHVRENHMKKKDDSFVNVFFQTEAGRILKGLIEDGLKLTRNDYYIDYAYGLVPKVIKRDKFNRAIKYKQPTQKEARPEFEVLYNKIVKEKPDIIIPTGNLGCKALLGVASISKQRGVPQKVKITTNSAANISKSNEVKQAEEELNSFLQLYPMERIEKDQMLFKDYERLRNAVDEEFGASLSHEVWVLPTYSIEYMLVQPNIRNLIEADFITLQKFIEQGESAFEASPVDYEFVDNIERVRQIFKEDLPKAPIVAWDLETNTLRPEFRGAKPLVISLSWKEGQGCTIPLEHKEFTWLPGHLAEIYELIKEFVGNPDIIKVGHNIQFDIRFLRLVKGFTEFKNHRDTKVMYYMLVNQDVESSLKLSDLSYEMTDMGGYDKPLEEFKKQYVNDAIQKSKEKKEEYKKAVALERKQAKKEKRPPVLPDKSQLPATDTPVNEVDGSDFNYEWIPLKSMLHSYASGDTDACLRIHNKLDAIGQKEENKRIRELYTEVYPELTVTLAKIEANGVKMDTKYTKGLVTKYEEEEKRLIEEMRKFPEVQRLEDEHRTLYQRGVEEMLKPVKDRNDEIVKLRERYKDKLVFNPNASVDKQKVLYEYTGNRLPYNKEFLVDSAFEDGIPENEIEWHHYRANKAALNYVAENFEESAELANLLLTHSLVKTRKQGFTYKLLNMVDHDGLLHGGFNPTGTATTRLSAQNPNLQQIPRKTGDVTRFDYKHPIKRMFVTSFEGGALLQLDYSSLETRILGLAAMDEEMTQAFLDGADLHKETATFVYGVQVDQVTDDMRSMAKAVTFGLAYGETPFSFAPKHGMTVQEAEEVFDKYFRNKPMVKKFIDDVHEQVKKEGFVECLHGFRRNLQDVYSRDSSKRNAALRQSVNTKIQGSGAFLTNSSVIHIMNFIEKNNFRSKVVLTVHDSIVLDCPPEEIHIMAKAAKHIMENLPIDWLFIDWKGKKLRYPIAADVEIGVNYNDMVDYNMEEINTFRCVKNYCKYHLDLKNIKNYKNSNVITEEKYEELKHAVESKKGMYQNAN